MYYIYGGTLDKAVMELKTKQPSSLANVCGENLLELTSDNGFKLRTSSLVECPGETIDYGRSALCLDDTKRKTH